MIKKEKDAYASFRKIKLDRGFEKNKESTEEFNQGIKRAY